MRAGGPTRIGAIRPSLAASTAPSSEIRSQGCATAVVTGGSLLRRSQQPVVALAFGRFGFVSMAALISRRQFTLPCARPFSGGGPPNRASMRFEPPAAFFGQGAARIEDAADQRQRRLALPAIAGSSFGSAAIARSSSSRRIRNGP